MASNNWVHVRTTNKWNMELTFSRQEYAYAECLAQGPVVQN